MASTGRTSPTKQSKGRALKADNQGPHRGQRPSRAHRDDTSEAKAQRRGVPKTHPTRSASAARKDKPEPLRGDTRKPASSRQRKV